MVLTVDCEHGRAADRRVGYYAHHRDVALRGEGGDGGEKGGTDAPHIRDQGRAGDGLHAELGHNAREKVLRVVTGEPEEAQAANDSEREDQCSAQGGGAQVEEGRAPRLLLLLLLLPLRSRGGGGDAECDGAHRQRAVRCSRSLPETGRCPASREGCEVEPHQAAGPHRILSAEAVIAFCAIRLEPTGRRGGGHAARIGHGRIQRTRPSVRHGAHRKRSWGKCRCLRWSCRKRGEGRREGAQNRFEGENLCLCRMWADIVGLAPLAACVSLILTLSRHLQNVDHSAQAVFVPSEIQKNEERSAPSISCAATACALRATRKRERERVRETRRETRTGKLANRQRTPSVQRTTRLQHPRLPLPHPWTR
jgi:hypothetical protein